MIHCVGLEGRGSVGVAVAALNATNRDMRRRNHTKRGHIVVAA